MKVKITLTEDVLGSSPSNEELLATYISSKAPTDDLTAEEIANIKAQNAEDRITVFPREIPYDLHGMKLDFCERPLRAQTPMGERVSIAKSESVPAGSTAEFEIQCLDPKLEDMVRECLDYGVLRGLGQWRNSGKGRFEWEEVK